MMTIQGVGAAFSPAFAGAITQHFGYSTAFFSLGMIAAVAILTYHFGSRWTAPRQTV